MDIFEAIKNNEIEEVKKIISKPKFNINKKNSKGETPLILAVNSYRLNRDIIKLLLEHPKIDVNVKNQNGWNALHYLCKKELNRNLDLIKIILSKPNIDVNAQNGNGDTALHLIFNEGLKKNTFEIVKLLLSHPDIDLSITNEDDLHTPLSQLISGHYYSEEDIYNSKCIELLLSNKNLDVNKQIQNKISLFSLLIKSKYIDIAKKLLNNPELELSNIDINNTILSSSIELLSLVINKKPEFSLWDDILIEIFENHDFNMFDFLITNPVFKDKININATDSYHKNTILHLVCYGGYYENSYEALKIILSFNDIEVNKLNLLGNSPLIIACESNKIEHVKLLLSHPNIKIDFNYNDISLYLKQNEDFEEDTYNLKIRQLLKNYSLSHNKNLKNILDSIEN